MPAVCRVQVVTRTAVGCLHYEGRRLVEDSVPIRAAADTAGFKALLERSPPGPLFLHWEVSEGVSFSVTRYPTCLPTPTAKIPTVTTGRCVSVTIGDPVVHGLPHVFWRVATERILAWNYRPDCIACT